MTTRFPSNIDDITSLYVAADNPVPAVLTASLNAVQNTLHVTTTQGYPSTYGILQLDQEQIIYTAVTATSFIGCTRGVNGTPAQVHGNGCPVQTPFTATFHNNTRDAVVAIETLLGANGNNIQNLSLSNVTVTVGSPVFNLSLGSLFYMNLTANVSSPSIINIPPTITRIVFVFTQDSIGGHTFAWPGNVFGGILIGSDANQVTVQEFINIGSNLYGFMGVVY